MFLSVYIYIGDNSTEAPEAEVINCTEEVTAMLTFPDFMVAHGIGSWDIVEETEDSITAAYVCADHLALDLELGLCTICATNPCGDGICIQDTDNYNNYDCDCGDKTTYTDLLTDSIVCTENMVIVFDTDLISGTTIVLPINFDESLNTAGYPDEILDFTVDWGDGSDLEAFAGYDVDKRASHTYKTSGLKQITLSGTIDRFNFNLNYGREDSGPAFVDVRAWGSTTLGLSGYYFWNCENLVSFSAPGYPVNNAQYGLIDMEGMFDQCSSWDGDMSEWDTSEVTSLLKVFYGSSIQDSVNIEGWDTSSVRSLNKAFSQTKLAAADLSNWDTSSVTDMTQAFYEATKFNGDVSGWDTSHVSQNNMKEMFYKASAFQHCDLGGWDTSRITRLDYTFANSKHNGAGVGYWDTSSMTHLNNNWEFNGVFNGNLGGWDVSNVKDMVCNWRWSKYTYKGEGLEAWDVSSVTNMYGLFWWAPSIQADVSQWFILLSYINIYFFITNYF